MIIKIEDQVAKADKPPTVSPATNKAKSNNSSIKSSTTNNYPSLPSSQHSIKIPSSKIKPNSSKRTPLYSVSIFKNKDLVEDMIRFILVPRQMIQKYQLSIEQTKKYIKNLLLLIK